jgi:tRNA-2-methylthio-N6-dimethylallyladenosine synthase
VDSYRWNLSSKGELKNEAEAPMNFAQLLQAVANVSPMLRVRFSTSHPKDMTNEVLEVIASNHNVCNYIHLPVQSGNTEVLYRMNRGYSREWYLDRIEAIHRIIPNCAISTDIITGFCSETDEEHAQTIRLMEQVKFNYAYMFKYSERPKTLAERKFEDDVPEATKSRRLTEIIELQTAHSLEANEQQIGAVQEILVEGPSKRSALQYCGRNSMNSMVVFDRKGAEKGTYVQVKITGCTSATLFGELIP